MRIVSERTLNRYRGPGPCECCKKWCNRREASHTHKRSQGRLDIDINLTALGTAFDCPCHENHERGESPTRAELVEITAARLNLTPMVIEREIKRVLALDKNAVYDPEKRLRSLQKNRLKRVPDPSIVNIEGDTYRVTPIPCDDRIGVAAFRVVKVSTTASYDVLDTGGAATCECMGYLKSGNCRHITRLREKGLIS